ncbi:MAG TPA: phosphate acyltransferase PlsX [Firmicutes bacterium]|nr:phosphate acyltransferase PlsX [Bacillota bacterium]
MLRVAVDAMGGDHAPVEIIRGVLDATRQAKDLQVFLVGRQDIIRRCLGQEICRKQVTRITIVHADEVIGNNEDPGLAIRRKKGSSMVAALQLARSGKVDAVLSAGSTGALMAGGLLFLGRLGGIKRPALLVEFPASREGSVVILDVGANMDAKPEHLFQYAQMGKVYTQEIVGIPDPRVALLNVGVEEKKGNTKIKQAYQLFKENRSFNFVGNIEAKQLFQNKTDIIICDGFVGNVLLKAYEGLSKDIYTYLLDEIRKNPQAAAMVLPSLQKMFTKLDESEYGGAMLIGVNGICIKCHGASKRRAVSQALLKRAYLFARKRTNHKIEKELKQVPKEVLG